MWIILTYEKNKTEKLSHPGQTTVLPGPEAHYGELSSIQYFMVQTELTKTTDTA